MSAFIITRIHVGDYDTWRSMFDQDRPQAREKAKVQRVFRNVDDPNHVFVFLEFASVEHAEEARQRLVEFKGREVEAEIRPEAVRLRE